ncbi:ligase-associated DNA damage response exonuclease [Pseudoroseomonas globiformis]|uniref:Ligase-associated DNA damage response exonuclease n=1 Tax=Teichococcus globiformis TaxID=2307229 RepID=A0ABV7FZJ7_9PROT
MHCAAMAAPHPETWIRITPEGLYCEPGDFHIDPARPVPRAIISHGHSDHARPDHGAVLATPETLAIMTARLGEGRAGLQQQSIAYHQPLMQNGVRVTLVPAGHVLGSAQVVMEWQGSRLVVSGDYKREPDPTCLPFEPIPCDVFVTEATFALPVFRHPPIGHEIARLLDSVALFPDRAHLVGCYALGKCQRVIAALREAGFDRPLYLHGAQASMCRLYERFGVALGELRPVPRPAKRGETVLPGQIVLAPPSAESNPWARRLADPVTAVASGWMRVRQRAKARGVELPLVISDHADWDDLLATCAEVDAPEVWVTHGREEALIHALDGRGVRGRALHLVGREEDEGGDPEPAADTAEGEEAA